MPRALRLSFFTYDITPGRNLGLVAGEAIKAGHRVALVVNDDLGRKDMFSPMPDVLVTSVASVRTKPELRIGMEASGYDVPWVVTGDTYGTCTRPAARDHVSRAVAIVASPAEVEEALVFGYGDAVYLGGPPLWQSFPNTPPAHIEQYRGGGRLVLVGGGKNPYVNDLVLLEVLDAMNAIGEEWELIFKPHPNEDPSTNPAQRELLLESAHTLDVPFQTTNLLSEVDVSIFPYGATDSIAGAFLRAPVISFANEAVLKRYENQTGKREWFPAESGANLDANPENLADALVEVFSPEGLAKLQARQAEVYPYAEPEMPIEKRILDYIVSLVP